MFKLVIQDDEGKTTVVPLIRDEITIGRKEGNTIRLTERNVSRRHARILRNNGEVHIEDLGSYNGIRVNNARIAERVSLRVSDQVQIGDYKLYLKAEGIEQVDASHTNPVERAESQIATESMPAVGGPPVTGPQPIQAAAGPQLIGNPAHTLVAIGGTDPGRSVGPVTAAAVAALSAPGGYGRLVVLSSNFAGKEFELSRPQMIVGRTDENDIVINHRSISRNHAKVVRDPDTGHYTISDLQSSNGVRVNGQDYGKVELRRGDVVDLGHVRLRFVDAGEDFVFARDAVITDVPETGGKRGVMFAVLAAIVVLGAGVAIYATVLRGPDKTKDEFVTPGPGTNSGITPDASDSDIAAAAVPPDRGSAEITPDASTATAVVKSSDDKLQRLGKCTELAAAQDWQGLRDCADALDKLGVKDKAAAFKAQALKEQDNELKANTVRQLIRDHNLKEAQAQLAKIGDTSVYYLQLSEAFTKAENAAIEVAVRKAQAFAAAHDCAGFRTQYRQLLQSSTARVAAAIAPIKCTEKVAQTEPSPRSNSPSAGSANPAGSAVVVPPAPTPPSPATAPAQTGPCAQSSVDEAMEQASHQYSAGFSKTALGLVVRALACKQDLRMYRMAAMYACGAKDLAMAKLYYSKLPPASQAPIAQRCWMEGLDVRQP
jgi:pSer/pThr/pTyr-binding forkhead associated (FHA) protein